MFALLLTSSRQPPRRLPTIAILDLARTKPCTSERPEPCFPERTYTERGLILVWTRRPLLVRGRHFARPLGGAVRAWWQSLRVGNGHGIRGLAATYYDHGAKAGDTGLTIRVGITAVGSGIAHAIVQSCRMASLPLYLVGFDSNALAFDAFDCDESHVVPAITEPHYIEHMLRLCAACGIEVLIPGLDADLAILAIHAGRFRALGTTPLVGGPEFVRLCRDKLAWSRELNPVCPAIVPAWTAAEAAALHKTGQLALPLLAKPAHGSGSASITVVSNPDDLTSLVNTDIVQPFILPPPQDPAAAAIRDRWVRLPIGFVQAHPGRVW